MSTSRHELAGFSLIIDNPIAVRMASDESELAVHIMDGRKCQNKKNQYRLKVEHFKKWLSAKHPECFDDEQQLDLLTVDKTILKEFLRHICKKKTKNGDYVDPVVFHAFQHVSGYKSAIKDR